MAMQQARPSEEVEMREAHSRGALGIQPRVTGDTIPCRMTGVTLHGVVSLEAPSEPSPQRRRLMPCLSVLFLKCRGSSHIRNSAPLGPYSGTMTRALWKPWGGGAVSYERGNPVTSCRLLRAENARPRRPASVPMAAVLSSLKLQ